MGFSEVSGGNYRHDSWAPNTHASLERAYEYALQMCPPGRNDYLGKAIRWYYGKDVSGEIVYAKNGNKVPRSEGGGWEFDAFWDLEGDQILGALEVGREKRVWHESRGAGGARILVGKTSLDEEGVEGAPRLQDRY